MSLIASGEHLRLARTAIEARQIYPTAHFTVLRGALVGAAQAVWILAPPEPAERQERGLTLIAEMYTQLAKSYRELQRTVLTSEQRDALRDQMKWCQERRAQVAAVRMTRAEFEQTTTIAWALDYRFRDRDRRDDGRMLWRQMSGDAHVLGWPLYQRGTISPPERGTSLGIGESGGDLAQVAQAFTAAHLLLKEGWSLFDRLCEAPASRWDRQA